MLLKIVLFLIFIPSPYRVDFFSELSKYCELTVCFEGKKATDRDAKWNAEEKIDFDVVFLKGIRTGPDNFLCTGVLKYITGEWDIIIISGYSTPTQMLAIQKAIVKKIPFYIEADGGFIKEESRFKYLFKRHFISAASGWFTSGKITNEYFAHYGADIKKCYVYPFTSLHESEIEDARKRSIADKENFRKKIGATEEFIVLTVGRFTYERGYGKGYDTIMRAAEKLSKNIGIYIVGGSPTEEFSNWKTEKKLTNVHFVDFKSRRELADYYLAANVFVLMTRGDVWGLVVNEAMMYGLPVITTNMCGAGYELVEEDINGYIINADASEMLIKIIEGYYFTPQKCRDHGLNSQHVISEYSIERMAKIHSEYFEKLI